MADDKSPREETRSGYELTILRHGIAGERDATAFPDDDKRPLTPEGKRKLKQIGKGMLRLGCKLDWIVTSPLVRAVETAEVVAGAFPPDIPMDVSDALRPGGSLETLLALLASRPERRRTMIVGHEGDLSTMAARLIGAGRQARLGFKKGGCCLIQFDEFPPRPPGQLIWWLTPRVTRAMA